MSSIFQGSYHIVDIHVLIEPQKKLDDRAWATEEN